jgi:hypothetical protein
VLGHPDLALQQQREYVASVPRLTACGRGPPEASNTIRMHNCKQHPPRVGGDRHTEVPRCLCSSAKHLCRVSRG